ncbi:MAG: excinuclease ABC subunit UvrB [Candidatus Saganbacteria bacterium]|nr:excinuclease ABC subunit UvrB [Candidatus Saganbacteria bacterium]
MSDFKLKSGFSPSGDQPQAIEKIVKEIEKGEKYTTLLGVTGSGKTFTMASAIAQVNRPTLILSPNKTLAAQLCQEFRSFFPSSSVEYFVSFYDYYQPEAYIPTTDTYIEKDSAINDEIDRLRHRATMSLFERRDVIVVASVSCIYGLGTPANYLEGSINIDVGQNLNRDNLLYQFVGVKYERNDTVLSRGKFRARGDVVEVMPIYETNIFRIELDEDKISKISEINPTTGEVIGKKDSLHIFPATHYVTFKDRLEGSLKNIEDELSVRLKELKDKNKLVEAQRLEQRTNYDIEMIREMGYCHGIENYSRHLDGRRPGQPPSTLIDYFPKDFLMFIDESHVAVPQIRGMYAGDQARKKTLVEYGFRLPSALDNRPLNFSEFTQRLNQCLFVSATPGEYETSQSKKIVEQIIRPTGLIDPEVVLKPTKGQIKDLIKEIKIRVEKKERVLVTTLTKRMAEDLSEYLQEAKIKSKYLHSDIDTLDRIDILRGLRLGEFDVLVGINLLREGLDLPEVSLVAIMDADKEGFLRGETSLIQTIGRAARNINGKVFLYADRMTRSMKKAVSETNRRRALQIRYNKKNNITPKTIIKEVKDISEQISKVKGEDIKRLKGIIKEEEVPILIKRLDEEMKTAAIELEFEKAAVIRDQIKELKGLWKK